MFFFFYFSGTHLALRIMWSQCFLYCEASAAKIVAMAWLQDKCSEGGQYGAFISSGDAWCTEITKITEIWASEASDRFGDVQSHVPPATPSLRIARSLSQSS